MATIGVLSVNKLTFGFAILNERTSDRFSDHIDVGTWKYNAPAGLSIERRGTYKTVNWAAGEVPVQETTLSLFEI